MRSDITLVSSDFEKLNLTKKLNLKNIELLTPFYSKSENIEKYIDFKSKRHFL